MNTLRKIGSCLAGMALMAALALPALGYATKGVVLRASAHSTATADTNPWVPTGIRSNPVNGSQEGFSEKMAVHLDVTTAASGTLDIVVKGRFCPTCTAVTLTPDAAWTQVATATSSQYRTFLGPIPPEIEIVGTGASTPDHTYSVRAILGSP